METKEGTSLRGNLNHDCARLIVAVADVDLDFDGIRFDAVDGGGTNPSKHEVLWPRRRATATAFSENHFNHRQPRRSLAKAGGDEHDAFNREKHQLRAGFFPLRLERGEGQGEVSKLIQPRMDTNEIGFCLSPNACSQNRIVTKVSAGRGAFGLRRLQRHCWNARKPSVLPGFVRTKAPRISECDFNLKTRLRVCPPAVPPENPRRRRGPSIARPR